MTWAQAMNLLRSTLLIPPIGLTSALEQLKAISVLQPLRTNIRRYVLVFGEIASQTLIDVGTAQN